jgi:hypothetical protein
MSELPGQSGRSLPICLEPSLPQKDARRRLSDYFVRDALLHSATGPLLYIGNEAIREYFSSFRRTSNRASITERHMAVLSETVVMGVGFYKFDVVMNGQTVPRPARSLSY